MALEFRLDDSCVDVLDRTTIQQYATCPAQARFIETGQVKVVASIAEECEQMHRAFGGVITDYVNSGGSVRKIELADACRRYLENSRPDLQPNVIKAGGRSVWHWATFIASKHCNNILRWDGGKGKRSGQLAWDIEDLGLRVTSEIDLLLASPSPEQIDEIDYKGGHKYYSAESIYESFQFTTHGWLVLHNYPNVNVHSVRVWNTRRNQLSVPVEFRREYLHEYYSRVRKGAEAWLANKDKEPTEAEVWPTLEKCRVCDAAALCPAPNRDVIDVIVNEAGFVDQMVACEARLKAMRETGRARARLLNRDLVGTGNVRFGFEKPKTGKPSASLYELKVAESEQEDTEAE